MSANDDTYVSVDQNGMQDERRPKKNDVLDLEFVGDNCIISL